MSRVVRGEDVRVTTLPNGLRVATDPMPDVESLALGMWVGAGTRHERAEVNGVAHLLEHMAFKGTRRRSAFDIAAQMEAVGGHLNAYTSREQTAFFARVLAEDGDLALDLLADILQHSVLDEGELARERAVVLQEIGQAWDTPDDIIFDDFQETAFPAQGLGRPVLGTAEIVGGLQRDAVFDFMRTTYAPAGMVLAAAGRVDHDRLVEAAARLFDSLPAGSPASLETSRYVGGEHREERDLEQIHLLLGFDGISVTDPDYYAASVLSTLFGGGMSSRLFQEIREVRGLAYSVYSFQSSFSDDGLFGAYVGTGETEIDELIPVLCDAFGRLGDGFDADEVARAKAQLRAGILMALERPGQRCEQLAMQLLIYGRPQSAAEIIGKIEAVDEAALAAVARRLCRGTPTLALLGPVKRVELYDRLVGRLPRG
jgi:predicted Zn-dependent peptidase